MPDLGVCSSPKSWEPAKFNSRSSPIESRRICFGRWLRHWCCNDSRQIAGWKNRKAAGIDPAPEMIAVARQKAKRTGLEIDFRVGVIEALPFGDNTFDVVTSSLMHHLTDSLRIKGLAEIWRTLKPGGRLVIADMRRPTGSAFKKFFTSVILHHGHVVEFGLQDLPALLKDAGFENIEQLDAGFLTIGFVRAVKRPR